MDNMPACYDDDDSDLVFETKASAPWTKNKVLVLVLIFKKSRV